MMFVADLVGVGAFVLSVVLWFGQKRKDQAQRDRDEMRRAAQRVGS